MNEHTTDRIDRLVQFNWIGGTDYKRILSRFLESDHMRDYLQETFAVVSFESRYGVDPIDDDDSVDEVVEVMAWILTKDEMLESSVKELRQRLVGRLERLIQMSIATHLSADLPYQDRLGREYHPVEDVEIDTHFETV